MQYNFRATVTGDKWPQDFTAQASNWRAGVAKIVAAWAKKNKGTRCDQLSIKVTKSRPYAGAEE